MSEEEGGEDGVGFMVRVSCCGRDADAHFLSYWKSSFVDDDASREGDKALLVTWEASMAPKNAAEDRGVGLGAK